MAKPGFQTAEILITVKTYPSPSATYEETVCVAGARLDDGPPTWIRLYPVRFRGIGDEYQFAKYARVTVDVRAHGGKDIRVESHRPDQYSLRVSEQVSASRGWSLRRRLLGDLVGSVTTCGLRADTGSASHGAPRSLGLIQPIVDKVIVEPGKPWDGDQLAKIKRASEDTLLGPGLPPLEPMPYEVRYKYRCRSESCPGHNQKVLDWELGEAGRKWRRRHGDAAAKRMIKQKWADQMCDPSVDLHFFIGNQARRHQTFSILGTWYPPKLAELDLTLF
ncbi:hypothetical protein FOH10_01455 [Nocardia otitidiscaviarum]|uniref:Uncharacterized protein n=1 Tax=Nocardia otitidiscaviarum TaxID=1823 RepID=A0A516NFC4_9NOCA|nr:hypothetical protein [Nocardia otitidiscaviarum]MCP9622926.1 hypothetical protein [Nocardia otitidiscaviarum]QDP77610.1 hypothetical protein FOH10_01455 [Nocardia otitidiscaviarum]